jgi:hypothetical protein
MAQISKNFITVVVLGDHNPQILNVDFLTHNKIVNPSEPGFEIMNQPKKFKDFLSTPPFARLDLGTIEFIVQQDRYQIKESQISQWSNTRIIRITRAYFTVLPHTPIRVVGLNMNIKIQFNNQNEADTFNRLIIPANSPLPQLAQMANPEGSIVLRHPSPVGDGRSTFTIGHTEKTGLERSINFNFEYDCSGTPDWSRLEILPELGQYFDSLAEALRGMGGK